MNHSSPESAPVSLEQGTETSTFPASCLGDVYVIGKPVKSSFRKAPPTASAPRAEGESPEILPPLIGQLCSMFGHESSRFARQSHFALGVLLKLLFAPLRVMTQRVESSPRRAVQCRPDCSALIVVLLYAT